MASEKTFKMGDVVQLKSGGPKMTIDNDRMTGGDLRCVWFAADGKPNAYVFPAEALRATSEANTSF
jgi:uncharacterized protein YodC (DUF2158 family)